MKSVDKSINNWFCHSTESTENGGGSSGFRENFQRYKATVVLSWGQGQLPMSSDHILFLSFCEDLVGSSENHPAVPLPPGLASCHPLNKLSVSHLATNDPVTPTSGQPPHRIFLQWSPCLIEDQLDGRVFKTNFQFYDNSRFTEK